MTKNIETNSKDFKCKFKDRVRITKYENIFSKSYIENLSKEVFIIDSVLETYSLPYKKKDLNIAKIIGRFYKKELCLSIL